jgi:hypothetical protein
MDSPAELASAFLAANKSLCRALARSLSLESSDAAEGQVWLEAHRIAAGDESGRTPPRDPQQHRGLVWTRARYALLAETGRGLAHDGVDLPAADDDAMEPSLELRAQAEERLDQIVMQRCAKVGARQRRRILHNLQIQIEKLRREGGLQGELWPPVLLAHVTDQSRARSNS